MCGIFAWFHREGGVSPRLAARSLAEQRHRGPDHTGLIAWQGGPRRLLGNLPFPEAVEGGQSLVLGHNRLSIIDLSPTGHQPMVTADGEHALSFNGEIYNYRELRAELEEMGEVFTSSGDAEVLLKALARWGEAAIPKLNGMWAFVYYHGPSRSLMLSRDRYGKKPLHYYHDAQQFLCASEIKAIYSALPNFSRTIHAAYLGHYLTHNLWPVDKTGATFYHGIQTLLAGESITVRLDSLEMSSRRNRDLIDWSDKLADPESLHDDLRSAVEARLRSDVPLAVLVSGGVDSSAVVGHVKELGASDRVSFYAGNTGFGKDLEHAKEVAAACGIPLKQVDIPYDKNALDLVGQMTWHYELPVQYQGNSIAMAMMYKAIADDGIRVVLDGTGGDEVFCGYFDAFAQGMVNSLLQEGRYGQLLRFGNDCARHGHVHLKDLVRCVAHYYSHSSPVIEPSQIRKMRYGAYYRDNALGAILASKVYDSETRESWNLKTAQLQYIFAGKLSNWLVMTDRNSMMRSLESRSPLLDYRLIKYVNLPTEGKFARGYNKHALRQALPKIIPHSVRWRRDKQGFRWNAKMFFQQNEDTILESMRESKLLDSLFDMNRLMADYRAGVLGSHPRFFLRLYSVAALEGRFACSLS